MVGLEPDHPETGQRQGVQLGFQGICYAIIVS